MASLKQVDLLPELFCKPTNSDEQENRLVKYVFLKTPAYEGHHVDRYKILKHTAVGPDRR